MTDRFKRWSFLPFLFLIFSECGDADRSSPKTSDKEDGPEVQEQDASLKERGKKIKKATFKALSGTLKEHLKKDGLEGALEYCSMNALALTDSLSRTHGVRIKRVTDRPRNPYNTLSEEEKSIFASFEEKIEKGKKAEPVIERTDSAEIFYAPIAIKKDLCLKCHGKKEVDIPVEHYERIRELYPEGKAMGYEKGDLRGLWRIEFPVEREEG